MDMDLIQVVQRAIDYIEANLCGELNHDDIARESFVSAFYLRRIFPTVCGTTLGEYIRNRRLSLSANDLLCGDSSILEIALKYGYSTPEGYTRAFYRYYGVTPSAARSRKCVLDPFERISVESLLKGDLSSMEDLKDRGYSVIGSDLIYYTMDMDKTAKWFVDMLGWHAGVEARDDNDAGIYGCALPFPGELVHMNIAGFNGIHFFKGEPIKRTIGFIRIKGIDSLYNHIIKNGWTEVTEVEQQSWGGSTCHVTTIDECVLMFSDIDTKD
jgi:AraC family transcriptional regulator